MPKDACPVCGSKPLRTFFEISNVPVHCNRLWQNKEAAKQCPKGDIKLGFCPDCDFITNLEFEPERLEYTSLYENSLHFSPRFQDYAEALACELIERYDLRGKDLIEIGSGKGEFLVLLCRLGNNKGVGFDPTYVRQEEHKGMESQVKFVKEVYSEHHKACRADLVICRQVLEHIQNPRAFLTQLAKTLPKKGNQSVPLYFEVPNALHIFRRHSVWDIIYEHCSYFTPRSLRKAFSSCGFRVCELTEGFGGQYLCIHVVQETNNAKNAYSDPYDTEDISSDLSSFVTNYKCKIKKIGGMLKQLESERRAALIWGAGSKGVSFLNAFATQKRIEYAIDINPRKQGMYIPGTGQQIVSPRFLRDLQPGIVIVMNPIYLDEIQEMTKKLGLAPEFVCG